MRKLIKGAFKLLGIVIVLAVILGGLAIGFNWYGIRDSFKTLVYADSSSAGQNFYTYTFTYYEEYWTDGTTEWFGEDVLTICKNDIVDKQNKGYATASYMVENERIGAWCEDYNCFSTNYWIVEKTVSIKLLKGEKPDLSRYREDFDCFYHKFLYWTSGDNKAYFSNTLPEATQDLNFSAKYEIADKLHFTVTNDIDFEATLNSGTSSLDLMSKTIKVNGEDKTVNYYGWRRFATEEGFMRYYRYFVFKGAYLNQDGMFKIGVCNIRDAKTSELLTCEYNGFTNQNEFNSYRSSYTGKAYYSTLGNSLVDWTYSLFGETGVVSNACNIISSGASIAEDATGALAGGIFMFSDLLSNVKVALMYIVCVLIVCIVAYFVLKAIFWLFRQMKGVFVNGKAKK